MTPAAVGLAVAVAVVAPLTAKGFLLLTDWASGPHAELPRQVWGFDGGLVYGVFPVMAAALTKVLGGAASWVLVGLAFVAAGAGAGRLAGGSAVRRGAAAFLYCVNPFVFERLAAGQLSMLLAFAALPFVAAAVVHRAPAWRVALWLAVGTAVLVHTAWLAGAVLAVTVAWQRFGRRPLAWAAAALAVAAVLSAYMVVPALGEPAPVLVDDRQLHAFATRGDAHLGLLVNVAGMYGFFRPEARLPKELVPGWPLVLAAVLAVVAVGATRAWRSPRERRVAGPVLVAGALGLVLALGTQGPLGAAYRWAVEAVPGFGAMREPQKFLALTVLAYAVAFGHGVEDLVARAGTRAAKGATALLCLAAVVAYTPNLAWGLGGQLRPVRYPPAWHKADRLMGEGSGKVLFLPWHRFLRLTFTERRVFNPADEFFRRPVIEGDNIELPGVPTLSTSPQSAFLESLFARGHSTCGAGAELAPLGVEYVVLAKAVDWRSYAWLDAQADLEKVQDDAHLIVYRNRSWRGGWGYRADRLPGAREGCTPRAPGVAAPAVRRHSPVRFEVPPGSGDVLLAEPFDARWRLGPHRPVPSAQGTLTFDSPEGGTAAFGPWRRTAAGYAGSAGTLVAVVIWAWVGVKRRRLEDSDDPDRECVSSAGS